MSNPSLTSFYQQIILIDDDSIHNLIVTKTVKKFVDVAAVKIISFDDAEDGLNYLLNQNPMLPLKTLVFLDINMPVFSGWDVLDGLMVLDEKIKENMKLYILTSSIDPEDSVRALNYSHVYGFLSKPLFSHLQQIFT